MTRVEYVLIGTDDSIDVVSVRLAELLGEADRANGDPMYRLPNGGWAVLDAEPFDPWADERLQGYRWQVSIGGLDQHGIEVQEAASRRVYELLAAATPWALALTYDHTDALVAARRSRVPHAR